MQHLQEESSALHAASQAATDEKEELQALCRGLGDSGVVGVYEGLEGAVGKGMRGCGGCI